MGRNLGVNKYKTQDELELEWYHAGFTAGWWAGGLAGAATVGVIGFLSLYLLGAFG